MPNCLLCHDNPRNFDEFLCRFCASGLGIVGEDMREVVYEALLSIGAHGVKIQRDVNNHIQTKIGGNEIANSLAISLSPTLTYKHARKFLYMHRLIQTIENIEGDIVECGVGGGDSLLCLCAICSDEQPTRKVFGFDSFEGFPNPTKEDRSPRDAQGKDIWSFSEHGVSILKILSDAFGIFGMNVNWVQSNMTLIRGWFNESLPDYTKLNPKIALLHLDCDLYESYKVCLETLFPFVIGGGFIAVDEYMGTLEAELFPGAKMAINEFMQDKDVTLLRDKHYGKYYFRKGYF